MAQFEEQTEETTINNYWWQIAINTLTPIVFDHILYPFITLILCLLSVFVVLGNLLVVSAIWHEPALHSVTNYLIASLAAADCLVGLLVMPFSIISEIILGRWTFGPIWCDLWHSFDVLASTASIMNLCAISLDRYLAITNPISYPTKMTPKRVALLIVSLWTCSSLISFPAILWWHAVGPPGPLQQFIPSGGVATEGLPLMLQQHSSAAQQQQQQQQQQTNLTTTLYKCVFTDDTYYLLFSSIVSFYGPLCVMLYAYYRIYVAAVQQTRFLKYGSKQVMISGGGENSSSCVNYKRARGKRKRKKRHRCSSEHSQSCNCDLITSATNNDKCCTPSKYSNGGCDHHTNGGTADSCELKANGYERQHLVLRVHRGGGGGGGGGQANSRPLAPVDQQQQQNNSQTSAKISDDSTNEINNYPTEITSGRLFMGNRPTSRRDKMRVESQRFESVVSLGESQPAPASVSIKCQLAAAAAAAAAEKQHNASYQSQLPTKLTEISSRTPKNGLCVTGSVGMAESIEQTAASESASTSGASSYGTGSVSSVLVRPPPLATTTSISTPSTTTTTTTKRPLARSPLRRRALSVDELAAATNENERLLTPAGQHQVQVNAPKARKLDNRAWVKCDANYTMKTPASLVPLIMMNSTDTATSSDCSSRNTNLPKERFNKTTSLESTLVGPRATHTNNEVTINLNTQVEPRKGQLLYYNNSDKLIQSIVDLTAIHYIDCKQIDNQHQHQQASTSATPTRSILLSQKSDNAQVKLPTVTRIQPHHQPLQQQQQQHNQQQQQRNVGKKLTKLAKERKAAKTLGIVVGVFILCWLPFFVVNIIVALCGTRCIYKPHLSLSIVTWLGWLNSAMNPVIYACWSRDFRRAFRRVLCTWVEFVCYDGARVAKKLRLKKGSSHYSNTHHHHHHHQQQQHEAYLARTASSVKGAATSSS